MQVFEVETKESKTRVIGSGYEVDERNHLVIYKGSDILVVFAAGQWVSIRKLRDL